MAKTYALVGNPNCGKTTLFNYLTKSHQHIGNWPGVTVEHKSGKYFADKSVSLVDLPGIYSLSPLSADEIVTRDFLLDTQVDVIINVVDVTNLERNLYLSTQLVALDCKMIIALNMCDEGKKKGIVVDKEKLGEYFGCPIMEISATKKQGVKELMEQCEILAQSEFDGHNDKLKFNQLLEEKIKFVEDNFVQNVEKNKKWYAIKLLENDKKMIEKCQLSELEKQNLTALRNESSQTFGERVDIFVGAERYNAITKTLADSLMIELPHKKSVSDKIDMVVTNKWLALPIFAVVMFVVFYVSIQSLGAWTVEKLNWALDMTKTSLGNAMSGNVAEWFSSLLINGVLSGVGGILVYIPQIMILFGFISILEACGYMSRIAFVMDRLMRSIGLSGQSLIPFIVGCGCTVPAVMTARSIKNKSDRNSTIILTPFMPCSAKFIMFAYFSATVFKGNALVAVSIYLISICAVIVGGLILKGIRKLKKQDEDNAFVMELPPYRLPRFVDVVKEMWNKAKGFIIKAGTVILLASIVLWFLQTFSWTFKMVSDPSDSMLASVGKFISPIFAPLGFGEWQYVVATLSGLTAKETVVATLEILGASQLSPVASYSFVVFNLLSSACISAIATEFRELGKVRLGFAALGFTFALAYLISLTIFQMSRLAALNNIAFWTIIGVGALAIVVAVAINIIVKNRRKGEGCNGDCSRCKGC
ncbi:MAG: ferrous iron transport protein B [Clostridia bacterium]